MEGRKTQWEAWHYSENEEPTSQEVEYQSISNSVPYQDASESKDVGRFTPISIRYLRYSGNDTAPLLSDILGREISLVNVSVLVFCFIWPP